MKKLLKTNLFMIIFMFSALATLIVATITVLNMNSTVTNMNSSMENMNTTQDFLIHNYEYRLYATAYAARYVLTVDELSMLNISPDSPGTREEWLQSEGFSSMRQRLIKFADDNELEYVYYYFRIDDYLQPLIDNDANYDSAYTPLSGLIRIESAARDAWNFKEIVVATDDDFIDPDELMTAYAPILNQDGEVFALVGVDIKDTQIAVLRNQIDSLSKRTESLRNFILFLNIGMIIALLLLIAAGIMTFRVNKKRADDLRNALKNAEHASRAKSDFLANMSHEMRTPLNAVIGMTSIAVSSSDPQRKEDCLRKIKDASKHLLGVINDVLDYSKIEADKFELLNAEFDFEKMLRNVYNVILFKCEEKNLSFEMSFDKEIPRMVYGDEQHISQVIVNFLSNAVKFTPNEGQITLCADLMGEEDGCPLIRVEVSDNGIGISDEQKGRLFRSFEQADNTITKRFGGTGLGLAISKRIVEMIGGYIIFESEEGKGSTFGFIAPFKLSERQKIAGVEEVAEESDGQYNFTGKRIMVVDDIEINREIIISLLESQNIIFTSAENGEQALELFKEKPAGYDLILMDIQMPEMDGYQSTWLIRALDAPSAKTVPIIAMTANVFREDIEKALKSGMNAHLGKPIDFNELTAVLQKYL